MEKEFIPYEQALALRELGFDEPCLRGWDKDGGIWYHPDSDIILDNPTFSQAFRWFREKYKLHSYIKCTCTVNEILSYDWIIHKIMNSGTIQENFITNYERTYKEAELECLKKLIEIVKQREL